MKKIEDYARLLTNSYNLILHGAPGTGKTFLAKRIAEELGCSEEEYEMVQIHSSYDYTDIVEGIKPFVTSSGQVGTKQVDGNFKNFCKKALKKSSSKSSELIVKTIIKKIKEIKEFTKISSPYDYHYSLDSEKDDKLQFSILRGKISPYYANVTIRLSVLADFILQNELDEQTIPEKDLEQNKFVREYYIDLKQKLLEEAEIQKLFNKTDKKFVFIIDEINRGDLSKIFGELFSLIESGHRGIDWRVQTQYQYLIPEDDVFSKGFYVPENVYIIGTMNDIDRSVESMDLAMRRRFSFIEITAADSAEQILRKDNPLLSEFKPEIIEELKQKMTNLNNTIISAEIGFSSAYQIGAAYFLKYAMYAQEQSPFECLWNYNLEPLLKEYLRGQWDAQEKLDILRATYFKN